jgi:hypothetical protein
MKNNTGSISSKTRRPENQRRKSIPKMDMQQNDTSYLSVPHLRLKSLNNFFLKK